MVNMMLTYLVYVPAAIMCMLPMRNQKRYGLLQTSAVFIVVLLFLMLGGVYLDTEFKLGSNTLTGPELLIFLVIYIWCLKCHVSKALAVFASVTALISILSNYAILFDAFENPTLGADSFTLEYSLAQAVLTTLVVLLFAWPWRKFGSRLIDRLELHNVWYMTLPFSLVLIAINLFLRPIKYETVHFNNVATSIFMIATALLVIWVMMHVIFYFIVSSILNAAEIEQKNRILEMQESQFLSQQRYMQTTSKARHDFRQSIRVITGLYDKGDYEALGEYLHEFEEHVPQNEFSEYCKNVALNAVLNYYAHTAVQYGIGFFLNIDLPERIPVSDVDLCIIVGNILENAITACQKVENGKIYLNIVTKYDTMLYIVETNDFDGIVNRVKGQYLPMNRNGHGQGLSSVKSIAERYDGTTQFTHKGKEFYSNVSLRISKAPDSRKPSGKSTK